MNASDEPLTRPAESGLVRELYQKLSAAEGRVIALHSRGLSLKEIAGTLFISPRTAAVHMHAIRRKMKECGLKFAPLIVAA